MRSRLRRENRCEIIASNWRVSELSQHPIQGRQGEPGRSRNLDPNGSTAARVIDDEARLDPARPNTSIAWTARQVVVGRKRLAVSKSHFEVGIFHGCTGYAVMTTRSRASSSGSTMTSQARRRCRVVATHRPGTMSRRRDVVTFSIRRRSTSVKPRSTIRFSRWELNSSSHSHQSGHSRFVRVTSDSRSGSFFCQRTASAAAAHRRTRRCCRLH